nr:MAG TPA: hypothetical protein [Caudoviricetes sp.]
MWPIFCNFGCAVISYNVAKVRILLQLTKFIAK